MAWLSQRRRAGRGRVAAVVLVCAAPACIKSYRKARLDLPEDERGVAELTRMVLDFKDALAKRDFELAEEILVSLEKEVSGVDAVTKSHPDFEDVARATAKARPALESFIRRARIDELITETTDVVKEGEQLVHKVVNGEASPHILSSLGKNIEQLKELVADGQQYRDDQKYAEAAKTFDDRLARFAELTDEYAWLLHAAEELRPAVEQAVKAEEDSQSHPDQETRVRAAGAAAHGFKQCTDLITELRQQPGYSDTLKIETALGDVSVDELSLTCELRRASAEQRASSLEWQHAVEAVAARVSTALAPLRAQKDTNATLEASGPALEALDECQRVLRKTEQHPGFSPKTRFTSALGNFNAVKLREACMRENMRIASKNPTLHWRAALARLKKRVQEAKSAAAAARRSPALEEKISKLGAALGGYQECLEQATYLARQRRTEWKNARPSRREVAAARSLFANCSKSRVRVHRLLMRAKRAAHKGKRKR
jgi:hypothetical protein